MNCPKLRTNSRDVEIILTLFLQNPMISTNFAEKRNWVIMKHKLFSCLMRHLVLTVVLLLSLQAAGQIESRLTYRRYTTQDGLPQMQTEKIWQDSRGYIYRYAVGLRTF